jgi:cytoskeletal protein RodZ
MDQPFDPYYQWLGIPPRLQPPHHYRLLGLEVFESNPAVIEAAADRQMTHVRAYQLGPYSNWSQLLLNELSSAKICLLTPGRKAAYDTELRMRFGASGDAGAPAAASGDSDSSFKVDWDDEELDLAPEPSPSSGGSSSKGRSSDSRVSRRKASTASRESPSASGIGKVTPAAEPKSAAAKPVLKPTLPSPSLEDAPVLPSAPARAWNHEPPYMTEYRRKFFENFVWACVLVFILGVALILIAAFVLPLFKEPESPPPKPTGGPPVAPHNRIDVPPPAPPIAPPAPPDEPDPASSDPVAPDPTDDAETPVEPRNAIAEQSPSVRNPFARIDDAELFVGRWRTYEEGRYISTVTLLPNRTARDSRHPALTGIWEVGERDVHIEWKDGWRQVLRQDRKGVRTMSFSPDDADELRPVNEGTAVKDDHSPEPS